MVPSGWSKVTFGILTEEKSMGKTSRRKRKKKEEGNKNMTELSRESNQVQIRTHLNLPCSNKTVKERGERDRSERKRREES